MLNGTPEPNPVPESKKTKLEETPAEVSITNAVFKTPAPTQKDWTAVFDRFGLSAKHFEIVDDTVRMSSWDQSARSKSGDRDHVQLYSFSAKFRRKVFAEDKDLTKLIARAKKHAKPRPRKVSQKNAALVHAVGDLQLGKADGDGTEGVVTRFYQSVEAARQIAEEAGGYDHIHAPWLGDCIEGIVSQGGKLATRLTLTLTEQIDLLENLLLHQIETLAPLCKRMTVVSVPGNHDETTRQFATKFNDSHAVQALRSVTKAIRMNSKFNHVESWLPEDDEMTVTLEVAGAIITHAHGHQWGRGKQWTWWEGQTFGGTASGAADILLCGHEHHHTVDTRSGRLFVRVPTLERESTWWRHRTGQTGDPGGVTFVVDEGRVKNMTVH